MSELIIQNGNNMPVQAPLMRNTIPYGCNNSRTVYAMCEVSEETVRKHLAPMHFEYVSNICMIYVNNFLDSPENPYMDSGIIFTVKYKDLVGGCYMYEWEDNDISIESGRYWGYPKKHAFMTLAKDGNYVRGTTTRRGVRLIDIEVDLSKPVDNLPTLKTFPHINLLTIPNVEGEGIFSQRVIARDNSSTCKIISNQTGEAKVTLGLSQDDPIGDFMPLKVLGGGYSVTDFRATLENGYPWVVDTII